jgi:Ethanolamine utilization protein EutJ (predicted chaperonin)
MIPHVSKFMKEATKMTILLEKFSTMMDRLTDPDVHWQDFVGEADGYSDGALKIYRKMVDIKETVPKFVQLEHARALRAGTVVSEFDMLEIARAVKEMTDCMDVEIEKAEREAKNVVNVVEGLKTRCISIDIETWERLLSSR